MGGREGAACFPAAGRPAPRVPQLPGAPGSSAERTSLSPQLSLACPQVHVQSVPAPLPLPEAGFLPFGGHFEVKTIRFLDFTKIASWLNHGVSRPGEEPAPKVNKMGGQPPRPAAWLASWPFPPRTVPHAPRPPTPPLGCITRHLAAGGGGRAREGGHSDKCSLHRWPCPVGRGRGGPFLPQVLGGGVFLTPPALGTHTCGSLRGEMRAHFYRLHSRQTSRNHGDLNSGNSSDG